MRGDAVPTAAVALATGAAGLAVVGLLGTAVAVVTALVAPTPGAGYWLAVFPTAVIIGSAVSAVATVHTLKVASGGFTPDNFGSDSHTAPAPSRRLRDTETPATVEYTDIEIESDGE